MQSLEATIHDRLVSRIVEEEFEQSERRDERFQRWLQLRAMPFADLMEQFGLEAYATDGYWRCENGSILTAIPAHWSPDVQQWHEVQWHEASHSGNGLSDWKLVLYENSYYTGGVVVKDLDHLANLLHIHVRESDVDTAWRKANRLLQRA